MSERGAALTALAAVLALAACGGGDEECGPVPTCVSGLLVSVSNPPAQPYRVEVLPSGQATPQVKDCAGGDCFIFFHGLVAAQVTVSVVVADSGTVATSVNAAPVYGGLFSSGRCGVDCRMATVHL